MKSKTFYHRNWLAQAILGLLLTGAGLSVAIEAGFMKHAAEAGKGDNWLMWGTLGLVLFNAGLSVFGNAVLHRMRYERKTSRERSREGKP